MVLLKVHFFLKDLLCFSQKGMYVVSKKKAIESSFKNSMFRTLKLTSFHGTAYSDMLGKI